MIPFPLADVSVERIDLGEVDSLDSSEVDNANSMLDIETDDDDNNLRLPTEGEADPEINRSIRKKPSFPYGYSWSKQDYQTCVYTKRTVIRCFAIQQCYERNCNKKQKRMCKGASKCRCKNMCIRNYPPEKKSFSPFV